MRKMNSPQKSIVRLAAVSLTALAFMQIVCAERAHAQAVVNPDFGDPAVGQAANGFISCPPTSSTVGWTFECPTGGLSGVQKTGSIFGAAAAPPGHQTAFIQNLGAISQTIEFTYAGTYTLAFYLSAGAVSVPANTILPLQVTISHDVKPQPQQIFSKNFTPASTSSFENVTTSITIDAPGKYIFQFANAQTVPCTTCNNFIYGVSIITPPPEITEWPTEIHPTDTITVQGRNFGLSPGVISIDLSQPAAINFVGGGKTGIVLNPNKAQHSWQGSLDGSTNKAESEKFVDASATAAVSEQTVWIHNQRAGRCVEGRAGEITQRRGHHQGTANHHCDGGFQSFRLGFRRGWQARSPVQQQYLCVAVAGR
jgi:hypothetical protein